MEEESVYLHISNSGVSFKIRNDPKWGATIEIDSSSFGNNKITQIIHTDKDSIKALAEMFAKASYWNFEKSYCCLAKFDK
jgi:hypothetical protein